MNVLARTGMTATLLLCALAPAGPAVAAPLFDTHEPLAITLEGPLKDLVRRRKGDDRYAFTLRAGGIDHAVTLSSRGKSRLVTCSFPPLRLEFDAPPPANSPFAGQHRLKLVTHCKDRDDNVQNVPKEYAAYRLFNHLSPVSYAVRPLDVEYRDTGGRHDGAFPAFAIEATGAMAERVGGAEVEISGVTLGSLDDTQEARVYLFQYLIGNTDWSLVAPLHEEICCHNGKLVEIDGTRFYVPYDFDRSGLVNAGYAKPARSLRIRSVTQRIYRGFCRLPDEALRGAIDDSVAMRGELLGVVDAVPWAGTETRGEMRDFLEEYFREASDADALMAQFERDCID